MVLSQETEPACEACPLANGRRRFLQTMWQTTGGWALLALAPLEHRPLWLTNWHHYDIPDTDGAVIDRDNQVILVRWQNVVYAFALSCPHQNTALRWEAPDARFQCPKHHSKYQPDGTFISGRATRNMDRLAIKKDDKGVTVDLDTLYKSTDDADLWKTALVKLAGSSDTTPPDSSTTPPPATPSKPTP